MASTTTTHPFAALTPNPPALPTIRDEDWRFTPLKAIAGQPWRAPEANRRKMGGLRLDGPRQPLEWLADVGIPDIHKSSSESDPALRLLVVNGYLEDYSNVDDGPSDELTVPHGVALSRAIPALRLADGAKPFVVLNERLSQKGVVIRVARNTKVKNPVQIVYVGNEGASFARTSIELEEGAELSVAEHFCGTGRHFLGSITEAVVGQNASLKVARVVADSAQAVHVGEFNARLARDARLVLDSIALEAEFARTELRIELDGEGSHCDLRGLALAHGNALFDHQIHVDHAKPHATSRQLFRNVLDDKSRGVFSGRVIVRPGANGTDATQQNNNLLLSDDARVDTKPMLEIYTDEVKCSHGATSGQLDANAVFFLRSRGLGVEQARNLLTFAFANEIIEHIAVPGVQQWLSARMGERFHGLES